MVGKGKKLYGRQRLALEGDGDFSQESWEELDKALTET